MLEHEILLQSEIPANGREGGQFPFADLADLRSRLA
jgi:hypothetical protein